MKNAHIIPHFLIKTATNEGGSPERDKELIFTLSSNQFVDVFYGRDISIEKIVEMQGKELSDDEIEEQHNPITRDFVFCRVCEKKFAVVESYIATNVYNRMLKGEGIKASNLSSGRTCYELETEQTSLYYLFVYSIFWRCSVVRFDGFHLHPDIEEKLRQILTEILSLEINEVVQNSRNVTKMIFPLITTYNQDDKAYDTTGNLITTQSSRFPYFIVANNMTFQLYEKEKQIKASVQYLYGLSHWIRKEDYVMADKSPINIAIMSREETKQLRDNIYNDIAHKKNQFFKSTFNRMYRKIFGKDAPLLLIQIFFTKFLFDEIPLAERYTEENFIKCVYESYLEFGYIPSK